MSTLLSGLAVWPGLLLALGGAAKAHELREPEAGEGTVLAVVVGSRLPLRVVWGLAAGVELLAGAAVLAGAWTPWPELAAAGVLAVVTLLALWGLQTVPDASCGCFGRRSAAVDRDTPVRAGLLAAFALLAAFGSGAWYRVLDQPLTTLVVLAAGFAIPQLRDRRRLLAARHHVVEAACSHRPVSPQRTLNRLLRSQLWSDARAHLAGDVPREQWRDGCWRYIVYPATYQERAATAVFALYLGRNRTADAVAFVDEADQRVLGQIVAGRRRHR